jgi:hypothetical protein
VEEAGEEGDYEDADEEECVSQTVVCYWVWHLRG